METAVYMGFKSVYSLLSSLNKKFWSKSNYNHSSAHSEWRSIPNLCAQSFHWNISCLSAVSLDNMCGWALEKWRSYCGELVSLVVLVPDVITEGGDWAHVGVLVLRPFQLLNWGKVLFYLLSYSIWLELIAFVLICWFFFIYFFPPHHFHR